MKLNLFEDIDHVTEPGDAIIVTGKHAKSGKEIKQLITCCPGCGKISGSAGNHIYDEETKTYRPSIVHSELLGGCGWHGWLTDGEFTKN